MSLIRGLLVFQLFIWNHFFALANKSSNPDAQLTTPELIRKYGYPVEVHNVLTEDGYILEIHRIPYGRDKDKTNSKRQSILVQHGLAGSSADWVLMGTEKALGYILADAGYDVWLGNNRGNIYSKNHTSLSAADRQFWDFSYHELGIYDLPATIDYILDQTKHEKLFYVGHSQGTTQFWVTMSQRPDYNEKIGLMIGLAPVAFTGNIRGPITKLAKFTYTFVRIGEMFGYPELRPRSAWGMFISNIFCTNTTTTQFFCNHLLFLTTGFTHSELSAENLTVIIGHVPAGASWKQSVHFGQGYINKDHFRQFDYDNKEKNNRLYNSSIPPEYELNKITAPVALFSSVDDFLAVPKDVERLKKKLANVVYHDEISMKTFTHYDFVWGKSSVTLIFEPILKLLAFYK
ncbi:gastric triacylglycerol lipase-like isoform X1 [Hylaeus volcanicus]|uniref:gastric triacylglycerol lipase-like isoform X1 n=1 Tax=Hylaeus volcanicus TaxID=313075 RepID=UPI0023B78D2D|nr:gastric triacylglycerol lipase-like isoform X1 [Hylaeus volcanicus]